MQERELITLALGNYATLAASQWANGTSRYDTVHRTLYSERRTDRVIGGSTASQRSGAVARVPRLVLLDAPHATRLKTAGHACDLDKPMDENEEIDIQQTKQWESFSSSTSNGAADDDNDNEDNEEAHGTRHYDPSNTNALKTEGVEADTQTNRSIKNKLFTQRDDLVPWWRYISSGVCDDSVHVLHPPHRDGGAAGDLSLLHSFGFGRRQLHPSRHSDISGFLDSVRRQLEEADGLQGFQCFVDADSAFGGATCNVMEEIWEDAGRKVPAVLFACFQPLPLEVLAHDSHVDFAERRRDEQFLNRLLSTTQLTRNDSAVYIPLEIAQWQESFSNAAWLENDPATAQLIAAVADSALYGTRDDGLLRSTSHTTERSRPAFYLHDWVSTVRPTSNMRVSAAHTAIPLQVRRAGGREDLWDLLQRYPLMPGPGSGKDCGDCGGCGGCGKDCGGCGFVPLTHAWGAGAETEAGRVLGHAVTLRGGGVLPDVTYPRTEALLRYGLPLRTDNYLPFVTSNSYPISSSFPADFMLPKEMMEVVEGIDLGTHVVSTYGSAPMLRGIVTNGQKVLSRRRHLYEEAYGMENDEWHEILEEAMQIRDDYDHDERSDEGELNV